MGNCFRGKGGYESPALGTYVWGLTLQVVAGLLCFLAVDTYGFEELDILLNFPDLPNRRSAMLAVGSIHLAMAVILGAFILLGFFISECFLCPICILSIVQCIWCLVATSICSIYWNKENEGRGTFFGVTEAEVPGTFPAPPSIKPTSFRIDASPILIAAVLSLACVVPFSRADGMDSSTPAAEALLYVPTITLFTAASGLCLITSPNVTETTVMGVISLVVAIILGVTINIANCACCPRILMVLVGAAFAGAAVVACIGATFAGFWYSYGRYLYIASTQNITLDVAKFWPSYRAYIYMDIGAGLIALFIMYIAVIVLSIFASIFALRSILCCCGKTSTKPEKVTVVERPVSADKDSSV